MDWLWADEAAYEAVLPRVREYSYDAEPREGYFTCGLWFECVRTVRAEPMVHGPPHLWCALAGESWVLGPCG